MFVKAILTFFGGAVQVPRPMPSASRALSVHVRENWAVRIAACAARTHFPVAPAADRATAANGCALRHAGSTCRSAVNLLRYVGKMVARAAPRAAYVGGPLTPTGYAILAMTVAAVAMVMMLSTSSVGNELGRALRLSWWFS